MITRNLVIRTSRTVSVRAGVQARNLSSRASSILSALDIPIEKEIPGVYDGVWGGSGDILESVCPTTGEVLARVQSVSLFIFRKSLCEHTRHRCRIRLALKRDG